jgi:outer membrane protein OmpA-like peptidoglycan-associated protein
MYIKNYFLLPILLLLLFSVSYSQNTSPNQVVKSKISFSGITNIPSVLVRVKSRIIRAEAGIIKSDKWLSYKQTYSSATGDFVFSLTTTTDETYNLVNYIIEFVKEGYVTKVLQFNAFVPLQDYLKKPFEEYNFNLNVSMAEKAGTSYYGRVEWDSPSKSFVVRPLTSIPTGLPALANESLQQEKVKNTISDKEEPKRNNEWKQVKKIALSGNLLSDNTNDFLEGVKLNLVSKDGKVEQSTTTNAFGSFTFYNVPQEAGYTLVLASLPPKIVIKKTVMTNKKGAKVAESKYEEGFNYQFLSSDSNALSLLKLENSDLTTTISGKLVSDKKNNTPLTNVLVTLKSSGGEVMVSAKTDKNGDFQFSNIPADNNYSLLLNENDAQLKSKEVFLTDKNGLEMKQMKTKEGQFFQFNFIPPDQNTMAELFFDDPWLDLLHASNRLIKDEIVIVENLYYNFGKWDILPEAKLVLDKAIVVLKTNNAFKMNLISHTDSRGSTDYNNTLSGKRAEEAVKYVVSHGIPKERIKGIGLGEQQLMNRCEDGVQCTEEEHAQNRRTEFKINASIKK